MAQAVWQKKAGSLLLDTTRNLFDKWVAKKLSAILNIVARKKLGEILVEAGLLDEAKLRVALAEHKKTGFPLGKVLVGLRLVSEEAMVHALSMQLKFPSVDLDSFEIPQDVLKLIPDDMAEHHAMLPFRVEGKFIDVAFTDPTHYDVIDEIRIRTRLNVRPYIVGQRMMERAIARYYGRGPAVVWLRQDPAMSSTSPGKLPTGARMLDEDSPPIHHNEAPPRSTVPVVTSPVARTAQPGSTVPVENVTSPIARTAQPGSTVPVVTSPVARTTQPAAKAAPPPAKSTPQPARAAAPVIPSILDFPEDVPPPPDYEALQKRVQTLEALVARDEDAFRKLVGLLIEKRLLTRTELLDRLK